MTYRTFLKQSKDVDARSLVLYATGYDLTGLLLHLDEEIPEETLLRMEKALFQIRSGAPLQYAFKKAPFYGFWFRVDERVLIPRFDSEILVNEALKAIPEETAPKVLDLGTGSGCLGLTIGILRPGTRLTLSDVSKDALSVAEENRKAFGVPAKLIESDLFDTIGDRFDLILSNPPYIRSGEIGSLDPAVKDHEPRLALDGGADGLDFYRRIAREAKRHLRENGKLLLEIGYDEGIAVREILLGEGYQNVEIVKDLAEKDRVVKACWNNSNS